LRVRDDIGRTPLHDACWTPEPMLELVEFILEKEPSLFFAKDKRGFKPFVYTRKSDWPLWIELLKKQSKTIKRLTQHKAID